MVKAVPPSRRGIAGRRGTEAWPEERAAKPARTAPMASPIGHTFARSAARRSSTVISLTSLGGPRTLPRHGAHRVPGWGAEARRTQNRGRTYSETLAFHSFRPHGGPA